MSRAFSVLLAEDDAPLRRCLAEVLAAHGWHVHPVGTGPDAVAVARSTPLDFSVLDWHLPGMTGIEVFRTISREMGLLPSILMSGEATREDTAQADALGVYTFLRKPLDLDAFRLSLAKLIRHYYGTSDPPGMRGPRAPLA